MKINFKFILISLLLSVVFQLSCTTGTYISPAGGTNGLVNTITREIAMHGWRRIAIAGYTPLNDSTDINQLSEMLTETCKKKLKTSPEISVVEDSLFTKALAELRISSSTLIKPISENKFSYDPKLIITFGNLTTSDAILIGTIRDIGKGKMRVCVNLLNTSSVIMYRVTCMIYYNMLEFLTQ